jgi:hypothetical protein
VHLSLCTRVDIFKSVFICVQLTANNELVLRIPYYSDVKFVFALNHGDIGGMRREVRVWKSTCLAIDMGDEVALALSGFLGRNVRYVVSEYFFVYVSWAIYILP